MRDLSNLSNLPKSIIRDLKQSRLWLLALALVVALVAIPVVLAKPAKDGGASAPTATPTTAAVGAGYTLPELKPVVDVTATGVAGRAERKAVRRLARKNPFEPLVKPKPKSSSGDGSGAATAGESGASAGSGSSDSSGSTGAGTTAPGSSDTSGTTGSGTGVTYFTYVAKVKFGELGKTKDRTVQQLRALPSSDDPLVVFMGSTLDGETAIFLVSNNADLQGDGTCKPSQDDCVFLYMQPGDGETFDVAAADGSLVTYELTLESIETKLLDEAPSAKSSSNRKRGGSKARAARKARSSQRASWYNALGRVSF